MLLAFISFFFFFFFNDTATTEIYTTYDTLSLHDALPISNRFRAAAVISVTARSNAASLARDGFAKPESFLTNWREASWISSAVAGGSKLNSVLMFRHMAFSPEFSGRKRRWEAVLNHVGLAPIRRRQISVVSWLS